MPVWDIAQLGAKAARSPLEFTITENRSSLLERFFSLSMGDVKQSFTIPAHHWGQLLTFEGKTGSLFRVIYQVNYVTELLHFLPVLCFSCVSHRYT
jgi:hypothetical protein